MKGQGKTTEKQLNEMEIGNLPGKKKKKKKKIRQMIVNMIQDLRKTENMQKMFTKT